MLERTQLQGVEGFREIEEDLRSLCCNPLEGNSASRVDQASTGGLSMDLSESL